MTGTQLDMLAPAAPRERCATCRSERPEDYQRKMWLEPVSGECPGCNHATLLEIVTTGRRGDRAGFVAAWTRHYGGKVPRAMRGSRR